MTMSNIDKLSKDYAQTVTLHDSDTDWYKRDFRENEGNFKDVADYLFSLPLSDRLTAEEKAMLRKEYADTCPNDPDQSIASIRVMHTLERLFGKDFFKEDDHD